ncbi:MAG: phosphate ABC transporter permease subunit PstC [Myxococcota bacterium]
MIPLIAAAAITLAAFLIARSRAVSFSGPVHATSATGGVGLGGSRPVYHAAYAACLAAVPGLSVAAAWLFFGESLIERWTFARMPAETLAEITANRSLILNEARNVAEGFAQGEVRPVVAELARNLTFVSDRAGTGATLLASGVAVVGGWLGVRSIRPSFAARARVESLVRVGLALASTAAIAVTAGIVLSLLFETIRFFGHVSPIEFLFGLHWSPQTALRADQVGSSGAFGAVPLFTGTLLITAIAMSVAGPIGLLSAVYLNFYASRVMRDWTKPLLEILAGVPTVVYGYFAAISVAPFLSNVGNTIGLSVASESALAAGAVMGVMIIPFVSSLSDDAISAVPDALRDGSYGLGATRSETIRIVVVPAALPGIMGGLLLAFSRAIGETMIVVMAAGLAANLTANPLDAVTTVTAQIVALIKGDQEFDSAKTLSAFALGLVLFVVTLSLNVLALRIVKKYRETYE